MMNPRTRDPISIQVSLHLYQLLLITYPSPFRREYGPQMLQTFRDCSRQSFHRSGLAGMLWLWTVTFLDYLQSVVEEHLHRETTMTKEKYILWSGWALMGGALIFTLAAIVGNFETSYSDPLGGRDGLIEYTQLGGMIISHLLFVFGIVGLHLGYGSRVSSLTRASLVLGVMCAAIALLGGSLLNVIKNDSWAWPAWFFGFTVMLLSLIPLGVDSVRRDLMPRRNWSALLAGLGLPLFVLIQITIEAIVGSQPLNGDWIFPLVTAISMGGLFVLGLALHSAQPGLSPDPSSA